MLNDDCAADDNSTPGFTVDRFSDKLSRRRLGFAKRHKLTAALMAIRVLPSLAMAAAADSLLRR